MFDKFVNYKNYLIIKKINQKSKMDIIKIYTDGSCLGNPGPGGYASILIFGENTKKIFGSQENTTNNRMELLAVIKALSQIKKRKIPIEINVDSKYVCDGVEKYLQIWENNGWKLSNKQTVKNQDLWKELSLLLKKFTSIKRNWVKAHNNNPMNELVDKLARKEAEKIKNNI
ncbi:ribonuclease H [Candidatus Vampirococcus lugosii]|uniref:ribonuclease H n=2 Tax=Candidatus Vampirococcus lugosii TaxID=2789015 RepID=A0ABS5QP36_9BACT|nr:ribonuclease H [Candidatus Vampirococcus lugosii]